MTHKDVYTKFMIEYDKEVVTTSYPSLTDYEIATLLDKAYLALIAQKFTGNNQRSMPFEGDEKAIEDLQPLVATKMVSITPNSTISNYFTHMDNDVLYILKLYISRPGVNSTMIMNDIAKPIRHEDVEKFIQTPINKPWMKYPVYYVESGIIHVLDRNSNYSEFSTSSAPTSFYLSYIKKPGVFAKPNVSIQNDTSPFELSDTMAEELINLALIMGTEIVESPRLNTKAQTRSLEA